MSKVGPFDIRASAFTSSQDVALRHCVPGSKHLKILCVDDEPQILEALAMPLGRTYEVEMAPGGGVGLEVLRAMPDTTIIKHIALCRAWFFVRSRLPDPQRVVFNA